MYAAWEKKRDGKVERGEVDGERGGGEREDRRRTNDGYKGMVVEEKSKREGGTGRGRAGCKRASERVREREEMRDSGMKVGGVRVAQEGACKVEGGLMIGCVDEGHVRYMWQHFRLAGEAHRCAAMRFCLTGMFSVVKESSLTRQQFEDRQQVHNHTRMNLILRIKMTAGAMGVILFSPAAALLVPLLTPMTHNLPVI